jgi:hypothetical protein
MLAWPAEHESAIARWTLGLQRFAVDLATTNALNGVNGSRSRYVFHGYLWELECGLRTANGLAGV